MRLAGLATLQGVTHPTEALPLNNARVGHPIRVAHPGSKSENDGAR
jgi:hypothetical protein